MDELAAEIATKPAHHAPSRLPPRPRDQVALRDLIVKKLTYQVGREPKDATDRDWFVATAHAIRDFVVERWLESNERAQATGDKRVYYLSLEFLIGRLLFDAIGNPGLMEPIREALASLGIDLANLREQEPDAALGNGGLGRLAACFMESMATLKIPAFGYGIRYEHGLFKQEITSGVQRELPEDWLSVGNPWEFERPLVAYEVGFGGHVNVRQDSRGRPMHDAHGRAVFAWVPAEVISPRSRMTRRWSAAAACTPTPCACGRRAHRRRCIWTNSIAATTWRAARPGAHRSGSPAYCIPATIRIPARNCDSGRNSFLPAPRCKI